LRDSSRRRRRDHRDPTSSPWRTRRPSSSRRRGELSQGGIGYRSRSSKIGVVVITPTVGGRVGQTDEGSEASDRVVRVSRRGGRSRFEFRSVKPLRLHEGMPAGGRARQGGWTCCEKPPPRTPTRPPRDRGGSRRESGRRPPRGIRPSVPLGGARRSCWATCRRSWSVDLVRSRDVKSSPAARSFRNANQTVCRRSRRINRSSASSLPQVDRVPNKMIDRKGGPLRLFEIGSWAFARPSGAVSIRISGGVVSDGFFCAAASLRGNRPRKGLFARGLSELPGEKKKTLVGGTEKTAKNRPG